MGCAASNPATHDTEGRGRPQRPQAQAGDEPTALAHGLNKYVEVEALLELLAEEDIVLVWASSLMRLAKSGGRFLRRQDLPAGAAVDQASLKRLAGEIKAWSKVLAANKDKPHLQYAMRFPPFVIVSYAWLDKEHPDADGRQLCEVLAPALHFYMAERARLIHKKDDYRSDAGDTMIAPTGADFAVFVDYSSLWQKERTDDQSLSFSRGLQRMDLLYAHQQTVIFRMTKLLEGYDGVLPYDSRGWPFFETAVSQLIKPAHLCLDLGSPAAVQVFARFKELPALAEHATPELDPEVERKLAAQGDYSHAFAPGAFQSFKGARDPPLSPDEFTSRAAAKTVTNGKDKATLVELQAKVTSAVLGNVLELNYLDLGWKAAEMAVLAGALPMCAKLRSLDLRQNPLGEGLALLGPELGKLPKLMTLSLQDCGLGPGSARAVAAFCAVSASLTEVC